jgi:septal ring factor EnvC (AmiA/AmiB activator)
MTTKRAITLSATLIVTILGSANPLLLHAEAASSSSTLTTTSASTTSATSKTREQLQQELQQFREKRKTFFAERKQLRCTRATARVDRILKRYGENRDRYLGRYDRVITRLENLMDKLTEKNISTGKLPEYVATLELKQAQFKAQVEAALGSVEGTTDLACGDSEGAFRDQILKGKEEMLKVRTIALDIHKYLLETVLPEIKALRPTVRSSSQSSSQSVTTSSAQANNS